MEQIKNNHKTRHTKKESGSQPRKSTKYFNYPFDIQLVNELNIIALKQNTTLKKLAEEIFESYISRYNTNDKAGG